MDELLTADMLASRLGISKNLVYLGTKAGQLPAMLIGRRFYCREEWVHRFEMGFPGFWHAAALPVEPKKTNPFLVRLGNQLAAP